MRIVSLVPSLTETVCSLGKKPNIVGCTQFCVRPNDIHHSAVLVGGTKDPNLSVVADLTPDLILVNSEENRPEDIHRCRAITNVFETFPKSPRDVPAMLRRLGQLIECTELAEKRAEEIERGIEDLCAAKPGAGKGFVYFIWKKPFMVAAKDTYISQSLELAGFKNLIDQAERYPSMELSEIKVLSPELIFLSSEPYPFRQRDVPEIAMGCPTAKNILKIDGQLMSWFGTLTCELMAELRRWPQCDLKFLRKLSG